MRRHAGAHPPPISRHTCRDIFDLTPVPSTKPSKYLGTLFTLPTFALPCQKIDFGRNSSSGSANESKGSDLLYDLEKNIALRGRVVCDNLQIAAMHLNILSAKM